MAQPTIATSSASPLPEQLAPIMEKLPPQAQEYVNALAGSISKPEEAKARSVSAFMVVLQLYAASYSPWFSILAGLFASLDPALVSVYLNMIDEKVRPLFSLAPPMAMAPAGILVIVLLGVISWFSWYLDFLVMFFYMGLAVHFGAEVGVGHWRRMKQGEEPAVVTPGGSLHQD